jgi:hypothetical protein
MAFPDTYRQQVALLIRTIPFVAKETAFALKGGILPVAAQCWQHRDLSRCDDSRSSSRPCVGR